MRGATSKHIITPDAVAFVYLHIRAFFREGFIGVLCYYSLHFTTTLLYSPR